MSAPEHVPDHAMPDDAASGPQASAGAPAEAGAGVGVGAAPREPQAATQLAHPWRTTVRSVAWYVLAVLGAIPMAAPIVRDQLGPYLGDRAVRALMWAAGLCGALLAVVQRVVLLPPVAKLLARIGLGTGHEQSGN